MRSMITAPPDTAPWLYLRVQNKAIERVRLFVGGGIDPEDDNVDVEIDLADGGVVTATFITPRNIVTLLSRWKVSGEYGGGVALQIKDLVVLPDLSLASIRAALEAFGLAFGDLPTRPRSDPGPET